MNGAGQCRGCSVKVVRGKLCAWCAPAAFQERLLSPPSLPPAAPLSSTRIAYRWESGFVEVFDASDQQGKALGGSGRKCPNCGDGEQWLAEMRRMGVYVPEPSTAVPTDEMVGRSKQEYEEECTAKICFCDQEGRRSHGDQGSWRLVECQDCGGSPIHAACGGLDDSRVSWHCYACRRLHKERGKESREGVLWEERERLLAASSLSYHPPSQTPLLASRSAASEPLKRITAETSFTDLLGCMLDAGEGEASPGDSDYESSSQETRTSADCHRHFLDAKGVVDLRKPPHSPSSNSHKAHSRPFPRQLT